MTAAPRRCLAVWFPDWPVTAWRRTAATAPPTEPPSAAAVIEAGRVIACSPTARADGVRVGMRRREAQGRCPELVLVPSDPKRDARVFSQVLDRLEQVAPGFQLIKPGLCAIGVRGVARYYGSESAAAQKLLTALAEIGIADSRVGVADELFTAEQAARLATPALVVAQGTAPEFLARLPVGVLADDALAGLLTRLGVRTLGDLAALDVGSVRERFGDHGVRLQALASGRDSRRHVPRVPPPELHREVAFEPPLELVDQVAFSVRAVAEEFVAALAAVRLVCTELRVGCTDSEGGLSERVWLHPAAFDASAVVDRIRWQLAAAELTGAVAAVRLEPVAVDNAAHHEPGLFSTGVDERMHHALSRVQAMLGHDGVVTPVIGGGRWLAERQVLVPWGERVTTASSRADPWPGAPPAPAPATVFPQPHPVSVLDSHAEPVTVDDRDLLSAPPALLVDGRQRRPIEAWAGPWPITERVWDAARSRRAHRFQVVDAEQTAWLLVLEQSAWWAEGRYD